MAKLIEQRYGKADVRVLKILRDGLMHTIREIEVSAMLAGDFETSYTAGDNAQGRADRHDQEHGQCLGSKTFAGRRRTFCA